MDTFIRGAYTFCKALTHLFYINLLWIAFTLLGGVVLGFMPSTVALYTVARKFLTGEDDIPIFKTFWKAFRSEFLRSNLMGSLLLAGSLLWYVDFIIFRGMDSGFSQILSQVMIVIGFIYFILLLYIFPVYVHYDKKFFQYFKMALMIGLLQPMSLMLMLVGTVLNYYFFMYFQGFIPLVGASLFCYLNMWIALKSFQTIENKSIRIKQHYAKEMLR
ncbi:YesL family protein [Jeotgalibacillus soli]|uniref:DUF624 domain-containing protein n=1 Tax=Jeotgalibacillus soli TaxID=889306 RepID=A0A0C2VT92_9BACL|nr:YesL family protein [Jeotgalibacillus soli]KIL52147.1 hypothetical protein KP78_05170 [Jeotgalibacillus soli]